MSRSLFAPTLLALIVLTAPTLAHADHGAGAFRLGAGSSLLSVEHLPEPDVSTILYGIPIVPYQTGIHVGYLVTDEIYLGLQLAVGGLTIDAGSFLGNTDLLFFTMLPRFAYQIALSPTLNLYFGVEAGLSINGDPGSDPNEVFKAAGIGGVSFFAEDSFSIDGDLSFGFVHHPDSANAGFQVGLNIIFSGWIGGSGADHGGGDVAPEPTRSPEPAPEPPPPAYDDPEGGLQ